jgi:hypothetical protein
MTSSASRGARCSRRCIVALLNPSLSRRGFSSIHLLRNRSRRTMRRRPRSSWRARID